MKICWALAALLISAHVFSQKSGRDLMDSLSKSLSRTKDDSTNAKLYLRISDVYIDIDLHKAMLYADSGSAVARKTGWKPGIADAYLAYGNIYNFTGDYNRAIASIEKGYALYRELGLQKEMGHAIYALGMSYERLSNYGESVRCGFESLRIFEKIPGCDREMANSFSMIAVVYFLQKDFKKSIDYSFKALQKQESAKNTIGIANEMVEMADTYFELHDSANAVSYNLRALNIYNKIGDKYGQAIANYQLGKVNGGNYKVALEYLFTAKKLFNELSDSSNSFAVDIGEIGRILLGMVKRRYNRYLLAGPGLPKTKSGILELAESYLQMAVTISRQTGDKEDEAAFSADLSELQSLRGDYKNAYYNFRNYQVTTDSIFSQENKNKIAAIESQQAIELKNSEIENKELQISNQGKRMWLLIICIGFLLAMGGVLYRQSILRKKTNQELRKLNDELDTANKVKSKFFGILSHDLRSPVANLINFMQLQKNKPGIMSPEKVADRESRITNSARSLLDTMESMLLWSKGQMEHFKPVISSIPVNDLFAYLQHFFNDADLFILTFHTEGHIVVHSDEDYLKTIMRNLTANAIKALQGNPGAAIEWKAWQEEQETCFSITDNGPGVSDDQLISLYDDRAGHGGRYGLGLHIIRDLTKAIGCSISFNAQRKTGTEFILRIPAG
jgi:signal transduction histidine kinase